MPGYDWRRDLPRDVVAGVAVAALLVPESLGYADVAGVPAEVGLAAAFASVLLYAVVGPTSVLVVGPASAVAALSGSIVAEFGGTEDAVALTIGLALVAGILFIVAGALRLGWVVNFISRPVLEAFVSALCIAIIIGQLDGLLGIEFGGRAAVGQLAEAVGALGTVGPGTALLGGGAVVALVVLHRVRSPVPPTVIVVVAGILLSVFLDLEGAGVEVVGVVPRGLPSVGLPSLEATRWVDLIGGGAALLLVGFSEGYAASSSVAERTGERLDPDQELVATGVANIAAGLAGGLAVGGSLSKSAAGIGAGARSQVANLVAGLLVLATLVAFAPLVEPLPEPVLAAVVIVAVLRPADPRPVLRVRAVNRLDFAAAVATFTLVLVWEPLPALLVGVLVSLAALVHRATFPDVVELHRQPDGHFGRAGRAAPASDGVVVVRFEAPLVYANAERLRAAMGAVVDQHPDVRRIVLDAEMVADLDASGADALAEVDDWLRARGIEFVIARIHARGRAQVERSGLGERFAGRLTGSIAAAVDHPGETPPAS